MAEHAIEYDSPDGASIADANGRVPSGFDVYTHLNNSSSSTINFPLGTTLQISSVGFKNLKKVNTNASQSSGESTVSKSNPLSRLFSKTLTHPIVEDSSDLGSRMGHNEFVTDQKSNGKKGKYLLGKTQKRRLTLTSKKLSKPDLLTQMGQGHKSADKYINGSAPLEAPETPTSRKTSLSSPVSTIHNFFHRPRSFSQLPGDSNSPKRNQDESPQLKSNNVGRSALSLSSNSSNSYVTDLNLVLIYNFTNPGYSLDESNGIEQLRSLGEFHRKILIPADLYVHNKLSKLPHISSGSHTNSANSPVDKYFNKYLADFGKEHVKFYDGLLQILRPCFSPNHLKKNSPYDKQHPFLGMTIEEIAQYVKKSYVDEIRQTAPKRDQTLQIGSENDEPVGFYGNTNLSSISLEEELDDDLKFREISLDLFSFFTRCMVILLDDYKLTDSRNDVVSLKVLVRRWTDLSTIWEFFNQKVRFNLLSIFSPLQVYLRTSGVSNSNWSNIDIENIILLAFRHIILIPTILERKKLYERVCKKEPQQSIGTPHESVQELQIDEIKVLKSSNNRMLNSLINCCGTVYSYSRPESGNGDMDQLYKEKLFSETFAWLTSI